MVSVTYVRATVGMPSRCPRDRGLGGVVTREGGAPGVRGKVKGHLALTGGISRVDTEAGVKRGGGRGQEGKRG